MNPVEKVLLNAPLVSLFIFVGTHFRISGPLAYGVHIFPRAGVTAVWIAHCPKWRSIIWCFLFQTGRTPLHCASKRGWLEVVTRLTNAKADVNARNKVTVIWSADMFSFFFCLTARLHIQFFTFVYPLVIWEHETLYDFTISLGAWLWIAGVEAIFWSLLHTKFYVVFHLGMRPTFPIPVR